MKRTSVYIITALVALLLLAACGGGADRARLARAESLMDEHPDSALAVLDSGDGARLRGADRALYALLLTQARDKNFMDLGSDSLMTLAVDHYAGTGDEGRLAQASYFRGRVHYKNGDYPAAIVDFYRTRELAETLGNHYLAGMACRGIADIYAQTYRYSDQVEYARLSLEHMRAAHKTLYADYALYDYARAHFNRRSFSESDSLSRELMVRARNRGDGPLYVEALRLLADSQIEEGKRDAALENSETLFRLDVVNNEDSLRQARLLAETGGVSEAPGASRSYLPSSGVSLLR